MEKQQNCKIHILKSLFSKMGCLCLKDSSLELNQNSTNCWEIKNCDGISRGVWDRSENSIMVV